jgi:hypothetical protein
MNEKHFTHERLEKEWNLIFDADTFVASRYRSKMPYSLVDFYHSSEKPVTFKAS